MVTARPRSNAELDQFLLDAVLRRLARGEPAGAIARALAVAKTSVRRLRDGRHVSQRRGPRKTRCPGCGGKVLMPCLLCSLRTTDESPS